MSKYAFPSHQQLPKKQRKAREMLEKQEGLEQLGFGLLQQVAGDAVAGGMTHADALEYANAVTTYLALAQSDMAQKLSNITTWNSTATEVRNVFSRQAIPMAWDYAEQDPFRVWDAQIDKVAQALDALPLDTKPATVDQLLATEAARNLTRATNNG